MEYVKTTMIEWLFDAFAPHPCSSCGAIGAILCESCKHDINMEAFWSCVLCSKPCGEKGLCVGCSRQAPFEQAWCVGERTGVLKALVDRYKFESSRAAAIHLADLLESRLPVLPSDTVLVGIPTTPATRRVRGFDHIGLIVRELSKRRGVPVAAPLRRDLSVTLHFLTREQRMRLGPSLFALSGEVVPQTVLLVDDIVTTGTTLLSAARLLKGAGVERIYAAVIARQPER